MRILDNSSDENSDWNEDTETSVTEESEEDDSASNSEVEDARSSSEASTESEDDFIPKPAQMRVRRRLLESDSEEEPLAVMRKRKNNSEAKGTGTPSGNLDLEDEPIVKRHKGKCHKAFNKRKEAFSSSDGEDGSEKCTICLLKLGGDGQEVGQPDGGCAHEFCLICIKEWSKTVATCPIDRSEFKNIIVKACSKGKEIRKERVVKVAPKPEPVDEPPNQEDFVVCETCGGGDREDSLLLCDGCDLAHHLDCLTPPLTHVPRGLWYCDTCERAGLVSSMNRRRVGVPRIRSDDEDLPEDDLDSFIVPDDDETCAFSEEDVGIVGLVLPRTLQNVRLRRIVRTRRSAAVDTPPRPSTSSRRRTRKVTKKRKSSSSSKRKRSTRRRKTTTMRKSTTRHRTTSGRKKKTTKRSSKRKNTSLSDDKKETSNVDDSSKLLLFGNPDELDYFDDDYEEPKPSTSGFGSTLGNPPPVASKSKAVSILDGSPSKPVAMVKPFSRAAEESSSSENLMGDILSSQSQMFKKEAIRVEKQPEIYSKAQCASTTSSESRIISTSVSRSQAMSEIVSKKGKTCDMSKIKSSTKNLTSNTHTKKTAIVTPKKQNPFTDTPEKSTQSSESQQMLSPNLGFTSPQLIPKNGDHVRAIPRANSEKESYNDKMRRLTKIGERVKVILKPFHTQKQWITKESYKIILKKTVEKLYRASKNATINSDKMERLIQGYVKMYRV